MDFPRSFSDRVFSLLAVAYPASFRRQFGEDMAATFRSRLAEVQASGPAAVLMFWVRAVHETLALGIAMRLGRPRDTTFSPRRSPRRAARAGTETLARELRLAVRTLGRDPGTAVVAVLALAIGIGVTSATFSIAYGTILRGLPFDNAEELVHFERADSATGVSTLAVTPHDFVAWREQQRSFEELGAYVEALAHLTGADGFTERLSGVAIDPVSFRLLRVQPVLGRAFGVEEAAPGAPGVMLISHSLWRGRFAGDTALVGQVLRVNGEPVTIIGVMPERFGFPVAEQFWRPLKIDLGSTARGEGRLDVFGRLRPGVGLAVARSEFAALSAALAEQFPETNRGLSASLRSFTDEYVGEEFTRLVFTMLAGSVLVLLIATANVTSLLIARAQSRTREVAVRMALGASRLQVVRQFLLEAVLLAAIGASLGLGIAALGVSWFEAGARAGVFDLPHGSDSLFWWDIRLNMVSLLCAILVSGVTALLAGLVPAMHTLRGTPAGPLTATVRGSTSRRAARFSQGLVIAEFALTTALVVAAGLTIRSGMNVTRADDAFQSAGIVTARAALPLAPAGFSEAEYPDHASRLLFADRLLEEILARPGVEAATVANVLPSEPGPEADLVVEGDPDPEEGRRPAVRVATVSAGYFSVFGVDAVVGRTLTGEDLPGAEPVVVINSSLAARYFPGASPLRRRIRLGPAGDDPWLTIVGVVPDLWVHDDPQQDLSRVFVPLAQSGTPDPTVRLGRWGLRFLAVAVAGPDGRSPEPQLIRGALAAVDRNIPAYGAEPMAEVVARRTARFRLFGRYYQGFGVAALLLAVIGLYGVMAFAVAQRRSEFGIRMALGAETQDVLRGVLGSALRQVAMGLLIGGLVAVWLVRGLQEALFQVDLVDPLVLLGVPLLLVATGMLASLIPALRASRVNPTDAIRSV